MAGQPPAEAVSPLLQFDGGEDLTERYLAAPDPAGRYAVLAQGAVNSLVQGDVVTWMADDNLGTPRDEVDNSGTLANHSVFAAFGADVYDSNPSVAHWPSFAGGHISAATGFENEDERWLDLADGDWLSQDPIGFAGGDANLSRYVGNSPSNSTDPSGLFWSQYQVVRIVTGGSLVTNTGAMGDFWSLASSDGTYSSGENLTPGASIVDYGEVISSVPYTGVSVSTVPNNPATAPPTSVYSLMVEIDPDLPSKVAQGKKDMKKLVSEAMAFYTTAPFVGIAINPKSMLNYDYVMTQAANKETKYLQLMKQLAKEKSTTMQINIKVQMAKVQKEMAAMLKWPQKIAPTPPPTL